MFFPLMPENGDQEAIRLYREILIMEAIDVGVYGGQQREDANVSVCLCCLELAVRHLTACNLNDKEELKYWKEELRIQRHRFWIEALWFITQERDSTATSALETRLREVNASCGSRRDYRHRSLDDSRVVEELVTSLFQLLDLCMKSRTEDFALTHKFSRSGGWPTSQDDLIPRGMEQTFDGLLRWWMRLDDVGAATDVLDTYIGLFTREVTPTLLEQRAAFVDTLLSRLIRHSGQVTRGPLSEPACLRYKGSIALFGTTIAMFTDTLIVTLYSPKLAEVYGALNTVLEAFQYCQAANIGVALEVLVQKLAIHCGTNVAGELPPRIQPIIGSKRYISTALPREVITQVSTKPFERFHYLFWLSRVQHKCDSPACPRPHTEAISLQRCSKCQIIRYCSRECQREDWVRNSKPHKILCKLLRELQDVTGRMKVDGDVELFAQACLKGEIRVEQVAKILFYTQVSSERFAMLNEQQKAQLIDAQGQELLEWNKSAV